MNLKIKVIGLKKSIKSEKWNFFHTGQIVQSGCGGERSSKIPDVVNCADKKYLLII